MRRDQEIELLQIENARLQSELVQRDKLLARIYTIASLALVHPPTVQKRGRKYGSTRINEKVFAKTLVDTYEGLPPEQRNRDGVAQAMGISRRTLHRYLDRYDIVWPPSLDTLDEVLERLRRQQAALQAQQHVNNATAD